MAGRVIVEPRDYDFANGVVFTLSALSQQSSAFTGKQGLRISCTQPAWFKTGANPTAAADGLSVLLPAGAIDIIGISPGDKIAVLQAGTAGTFHAVPI